MGTRTGTSAARARAGAILMTPAIRVLAGSQLRVTCQRKGSDIVGPPGTRAGRHCSDRADGAPGRSGEPVAHDRHVAKSDRGRAGHQAGIDADARDGCLPRDGREKPGGADGELEEGQRERLWRRAGNGDPNLQPLWTGEWGTGDLLSRVRTTAPLVDLPGGRSESGLGRRGRRTGLRPWEEGPGGSRRLEHVDRGGLGSTTWREHRLRSAHAGPRRVGDGDSSGRHRSAQGNPT